MNSSTGMPLRMWTFLKTVSDICGFWSSPTWLVAVTRPSRNTAIVTTATRIVRLHPNFMSSPFRADLLLGKTRRLRAACDKQRFVRCVDLGDSCQRAPRLHDLAAVRFKDHSLARQEILRPPTLPAHSVRAGQLQVPIGHVTLRICDIDVDAHMRIQ